MEKPVRILTNEKIRNFHEKVRHGLEHAINFMLGGQTTIEIGGFQPFLMPIETYLNAYKKQSILVKIHAENGFSGELYWFFELKSAIALGCMMRMMSPSATEEKLASNSFDATDQDAFGEVGNQLCGILDRAFRNLTRKSIHLKMDFDKKVYPEEAMSLNTFVRDEEYVVLLSSLTIHKRSTEKLTLLLPRSLYEVLLNLEVSLEGVITKIILVHTRDKDLIEKIQTQINSRNRKVIVCEEPDEILTMVDMKNVAAVGLELPDQGTPFSVNEAIFMKRLASNRTLMSLPYFLTWSNINPVSKIEAELLGLKGTTTGDFKTNFLPWANAMVPERAKS